jgi:hypothetical protein
LTAIGRHLSDREAEHEVEQEIRVGRGRLEALPLELEYCHTRLADGREAAWIARRFGGACAARGMDIREKAGRLVVDSSEEA